MLDVLPAVAEQAAKDTVKPESFDSDALIRRLNRIEGQVRGIRRMIEEPRDCIEILQQLAAAEAALSRISLAVFRHHIDHCVEDAIERGDGEHRQQLHELIDIVERFGGR